MSLAMMISITRDALWVTMLISGPMLLVGLVIGLVIGIFQAVTQIHEMTLTFIPKIIAVGLTMLLLMPWMLNTFIDYTNNLFNIIGTVAR
ncbi:MAG: flagellar biosynthesis protein FliQ [Fibrobacteres bacterium]|nr:flagellar biosynthesis protein FliQ [Fibrobacterota bacterium]